MFGPSAFAAEFTSATAVSCSFRFQNASLSLLVALWVWEQWGESTLACYQVEHEECILGKALMFLQALTPPFPWPLCPSCFPASFHTLAITIMFPVQES